MTLEINVSLERPQFTLQVDCALPARGVSALFGRSGCGKTTLLRCLAGLEPAARGEIRLNGETWLDARGGLPAHRRGLGYVFQESSLFSHLDVRDNLAYGLRRVPAQGRRFEFNQVVQLLGLDAMLARRPGTLSGGERQRVAIGRALLASPRLLMLDEPLASVDEVSKATLLPLLERLREELSIPLLYVSHSLAEVMRLADHLVMLDHGRIQATGPLAALLSRLDLPLASLAERGVVLEGEIERHDLPHHLSLARISAGRLLLPWRDLPLGRRVRVRIDARDVSLALEPPARTSLSNILPARVVEVGGDQEPAELLVRLEAGADHLLARITRRSAGELGIVPGTRLYALIKTVALMER